MLPPNALIPPPYDGVLFGIFVVGTVVLMAVLYVQGRPLQTPAAPRGVLSYEFAWTRHKAEAVIRSWDRVRQTAERQLLIDFGFLVVYPVALALGCGMASGWRGNPLPVAGEVLAWAVLLCAPLDTAENITLLRMLRHAASDTLARVAGWCAAVKFLLIVAALVYFILSGLTALAG